MKAALVTTAGKPPVYGDFADPLPLLGEHRVTVAAAPIIPLARGRAAGTHYTAGAQYPFVAGVDGVGRLDDGRRVYFLLPRAPHGSMAQQTVVNAAYCVPVPDDLDDVTAAALANPGMSSWAAYTERAQLRSGETVLVNGATGASGRLAVQIARHLGAKKVIATGRSVQSLQEVAALGADVTIPLIEDADAVETRFKEEFTGGVDVVIDYLWGRSAELLLSAAAKAGPTAVPIRFVQIGAISGPAIALPGAILRSSAIQLMGSGIGSLLVEQLVAAVDAVLRTARQAGFTIATTALPLASVERAWLQDDHSSRTVITVNG